MSKGPGRTISDTLANVAARLRSTHQGERDSARSLLLMMCKKYNRDPRDYGVEPLTEPEWDEKLFAKTWRYERAKLLQRLAHQGDADAETAPDPAAVRYAARLRRFEAARIMHWLRHRVRVETGDGGGCAIMIPGYEDVPHQDYCESPVCPHQGRPTRQAA
ncbi:MAG TPA: hypothetical protein VF680_11475 [Allosphingosinicella sp.]|jgi:hypothetical protein